MANTLYNIARLKFLTEGIHWENHTIKCCLVTTTPGGYSFVATEENMTAVSAKIVDGQIEALTTSTTALGAADAADVTFTGVTASADAIEALVIYQENDAGDQSLNIPIAYIDSATGLPITPNGGDIIVTWDSGDNRIFRL